MRIKKAVVFFFIFFPLAASAQKAPDFLRQGIPATDSEISAAVEMYNQGWRYTMPYPKSAKARWGNRDNRTIWYNGYWKNEKTGAYSDATPKRNGAGEYTGDGEDSSYTYRSGGSPGKPDVFMFLLSKSGGPSL